MTATMFLQVAGIVNVPENFTQFDVRTQVRPLPTIVAEPNAWFGVIAARFVPHVGSVEAAPNAETNVAGMLSVVPEEDSASRTILSVCEPVPFLAFIEKRIVRPRKGAIELASM